MIDDISKAFLNVQIKMHSKRMPLDNSKFNLPPSVIIHVKSKLINHPVRNLWKGTHCRVLAAGNIQGE